MNIKRIRQDFPILGRRINGKPLVYLDNAATSQKPRQVLQAIRDYYERTNSNVHRGVHTLSNEATQLYEEARETLAGFIGAEKAEEIVFTKNATEALNLAANTLSKSFLRRGDEVLLTVMEHHSNLVPWQMLRSKGVKLRFIRITQDGLLDTALLEESLSKKTKVVALTHVSNVLGTINPVRKIARAAHDNNSLVLVDGAQSAPHMPVNVRKLNADLFAFSGHKMLGPTGTGGLYIREGLSKHLPPWMGGGDMIREVGLLRSTYNEPPYRFEAGTPNVAGAVGLGAAAKYLQRIGMEEVSEHVHMLSTYAVRLLRAYSDVAVYGPRDLRKRTGAVSFSMRGVHPHDVATILDSEGIAIRSGHHCAQPLMKLLGVPATSRASFALYNTKEEVRFFAESLERVREVFG